ncbi:MAG: YlmC/YmxH family sporulation protein [Bacilli bacterium]|nr:YlmC/YmxH family sporulation protein [Bacilli bacterium]
MRLSDLQNKDVVDLVSGEKIGNVVDVEISNDTGNILKMIVYDRKGFMNLLRGNNEITITWQQIKKIGSDVILVSRNL